MELTKKEIKKLEELKDKFISFNNLLKNSEYNIYSDLYEQYIYLNEFKKFQVEFINLTT
ncbi:hypothetical protein LCGC14_2555550 [marine sediment metagenome]|uniref:Uncharacterized protein n=1 Tax=marine sediment metagenome TaxID=412755 RepID=A0A0F9B9I5_9ZZZZ